MTDRSMRDSYGICCECGHLHCQCSASVTARSMAHTEALRWWYSASADAEIPPAVLTVMLAAGYVSRSRTIHGAWRLTKAGVDAMRDYRRTGATKV